MKPTATGLEVVSSFFLRVGWLVVHLFLVHWFVCSKTRGKFEELLPVKFENEETKP